MTASKAILHEQVCSGTLALSDAQQEIVSEWHAVYQALSGAAAPPLTSSDSLSTAPRHQIRP
ncbi:MAG: hypothetical protein JOZ87_25785 [Chloroflexi bacterium]|nr:hypothetical protein [Chloroflexota bacterium]